MADKLSIYRERNQYMYLFTIGSHSWHSGFLISAPEIAPKLITLLRIRVVRLFSECRVIRDTSEVRGQEGLILKRISN